MYICDACCRHVRQRKMGKYSSVAVNTAERKMLSPIQACSDFRGHVDMRRSKPQWTLPNVLFHNCYQ